MVREEFMIFVYLRGWIRLDTVVGELLELRNVDTNIYGVN